MSEITIRAKSVLKVTDGVNNVDFMADKGVIFSDFISRLPGVVGLSEQNKQLIAKLGLISIAADEGNLEKANTNKRLLEALADISNMCIGDQAMGYPLDSQIIGQLIFEATGMTNPELNKAIT